MFSQGTRLMAPQFVGWAYSQGLFTGPFGRKQNVFRITNIIYFESQPFSDISAHN